MEDVYISKIMQSPEDKSVWDQYEQYLLVKGDMRGEVLCLSNTKAKNTEQKKRLFYLISKCNKKWIAQFQTFKGKVKIFREIEGVISTYGYAPEKHGAIALKVGYIPRAFLIREGWDEVGSSKYYYYLKPPESESKITDFKRIKIKLYVPQLEEIVEIASRLRESGKNNTRQTVEIFGPWILQYTPGGIKYAEIFHNLTMTNEFTDYEYRSLGKFDTTEEFEFGVDAPYRVKIKWNNDDSLDVKEFYSGS